MYTIYHNSTNQGLDLKSFSRRMIQICNDHRKRARAMAFAFILYDFENPQFFKILNDRDYWLALNQISGKYLTIFSLNYRESRGRRNLRVQRDMPIQMLTSIPATFNPAEGTNALIEKYFGADFTVTYPAILFFQVNRNAIVDSLMVELREEQIELAFLELKEYVARAVEALKKIHPENVENIQEIFDCLERDVRSARNMRTAKRIVKGAGGIAELLALVKGLPRVV